MIDITTFRTEGLGDSTYLLRFDGKAILVDPQRDVERFLDHLDGADLRWVIETHLHNDYVSGGLIASQMTGAELLFPAAGAPAFRHTPAFHGEDFVDGPLTIRPLHTPGHTPEHTSYVVLVDGKEEAVFTGGSLLVGSAGRSDLLGHARADTLARLQYLSLQRLGRLPDETGVYPTHGAGSFCVASPAGDTVSTIGKEKSNNPLLSIPDEDTFVASHLSGLQPYPAYYARMAPINLGGPTPLAHTILPRAEYEHLGEEAVVVDLRTPEEFAAGHYPGSFNIPLENDFATWFGWLIPPDAHVYLVSDSVEELDRARLQLARIGIDSLAGRLSPQGAENTGRTATPSQVPDHAQVLDVRSPGERQDFAPAGTFHTYLPDLMEGPPPELDPTEPVWVVCASGYRSSIASSILRRHGFDAIPILDGGVYDLERRTDRG